MTENKQENSDQNLFPAECQNAIFSFLFILIDLYKRELPYDQAVDKACNWLISLANHIKKTNLEITNSKTDFSDLLFKAQENKSN